MDPVYLSLEEYLLISPMCVFRVYASWYHLVFIWYSYGITWYHMTYGIWHHLVSLAYGIVLGAIWCYHCQSSHCHGTAGRMMAISMEPTLAPMVACSAADNSSDVEGSLSRGNLKGFVGEVGLTDPCFSLGFVTGDPNPYTIWTGSKGLGNSRLRSRLPMDGACSIWGKVLRTG